MTEKYFAEKDESMLENSLAVAIIRTRIRMNLQSSTSFEILTYLRCVFVEVPSNLLIELLVPLIDRRNILRIKLDPALFVRSFLRAALHLAGETLRALLLVAPVVSEQFLRRGEVVQAVQFQRPVRVDARFVEPRLDRPVVLRREAPLLGLGLVGLRDVDGRPLI